MEAPRTEKEVYEQVLIYKLKKMPELDRSLCFIIDHERRLPQFSYSYGRNVVILQPYAKKTKNTIMINNKPYRVIKHPLCKPFQWSIVLKLDFVGCKLSEPTPDFDWKEFVNAVIY